LCVCGPIDRLQDYEGAGKQLCDGRTAADIQEECNLADSIHSLWVVNNDTIDDVKLKVCSYNRHTLPGFVSVLCVYVFINVYLQGNAGVCKQFGDDGPGLEEEDECSMVSTTNPLGGMKCDDGRLKVHSSKQIPYLFAVCPFRYCDGSSDRRSPSVRTAIRRAHLGLTMVLLPTTCKTVRWQHVFFLLTVVLSSCVCVG
jgi:hypothetical protein